MKNREIACIYYLCEGECQKGRKGTFRKACQHCDLYSPISGGEPARKDLRRKKREDARRKDMRKENRWDDYYD